MLSMMNLGLSGSGIGWRDSLGLGSYMPVTEAIII